MNKILLIVLLVLSNNVLAGGYTYKNDNISFNANGYLGYKYIYTSAKHENEPSEPELGLALSLDIGNNLSLYTQFMYDEDIENALVYSFASYDKLITEDLTIGIKAGKLRHDFALYNADRINPRSRQGVIVPQAIYWDSLDYLLTSGVGINFNFKWKNLEVSYTIDAPVVTNPEAEAKMWSAVLVKSLQDDFGNHELLTVKYSFDSIPLLIKGAWTRLNWGDDITPLGKAIAGGIPDPNDIITLGFETRIDSFTFSAETLVIKPGLVNSWRETDRFSYGTSYTAQYEVDENVKLYTNYNYYYTAALGRSKPPYWFTHTHDVSVGVNYHQNDWQVSAEVHKVQGGRWVSYNNWIEDPESYKDWYMVGVNAVYFF
jgi:hypothetical protein